MSVVSAVPIIGFIGSATRVFSNSDGFWHAMSSATTDSNKITRFIILIILVVVEAEAKVKNEVKDKNKNKNKNKTKDETKIKICLNNLGRYEFASDTYVYDVSLSCMRGFYIAHADAYFSGWEHDARRDVSYPVAFAVA